jgi:protein phosphatase
VNLQCVVVSDSGQVRENNEDAARALLESGLFIVADGMGGHIAGEVASRVASDAIVEVFSSGVQPRLIRDEASRLGEALIAANTAVRHEAERLELVGMGTTLTALLIRGSTATIAHIGDSRVYLVRKGTLRQLTRDHTLVSLLIESGAIPPEQGAMHPERHVLTQAVGTQVAVHPDVAQYRISKGSRFLLSSDGLHDVVPQDEILDLAQNPDLDEAARALVDRANSHGGPDNITVVLVDAS